jgi:hypothetical protein
MAAKAHEISLEAGSKMAAAMKDVIGAAAGLTGLVLESARDLLQYMVRRGQMTQDEADKLMREVEASHAKRKPAATAAAPASPPRVATPAATAQTPPRPTPPRPTPAVVVPAAKPATAAKHSAPPAAAKKAAVKKPTMKPAAKKHPVKSAAKPKAKASAKTAKRR